ncbi:MAG: hypothetical protein ABFR82_02515 [Nitrospirota bacterium]
MSLKTITASLKIKDDLSLEELVGRKTKKEAEILKSLSDWHNKSSKENFFIGKLKKRPK